MMFFVYSLIVFLILSIVAINIQPYKKVASRCSLMDTVFYILLSLGFIAIDVITIGKIFSVYLPFLTVCIPIVYIATFISIWINLRIKMRCIKN